jgi:hypothetical protein
MYTRADILRSHMFLPNKETEYLKYYSIIRVQYHEAIITHLQRSFVCSPGPFMTEKRLM